MSDKPQIEPCDFDYTGTSKELLNKQRAETEIQPRTAGDLIAALKANQEQKTHPAHVDLAYLTPGHDNPFAPLAQRFFDLWDKWRQQDIVDYWRNRSEMLSDALILTEDQLKGERELFNIATDKIVEVTMRTEQLEFLLSQAPMLNLPKDYDGRAARSLPSAYAYINSKTAEERFNVSVQALSRGYTTFPPSPTKWIIDEAILDGCVIFSSNLIPEGYTK